MCSRLSLFFKNLSRNIVSYISHFSFTIVKFIIIFLILLVCIAIAWNYFERRSTIARFDKKYKVSVVKLNSIIDLLNKK